MNVKNVIISILSSILFGSCLTPKDVTYFQGIDRLDPEQIAIMNQGYSTRIITDDVLTISVSSIDPKASTMFNPPVYAYNTNNTDETSSISQTLFTYSVDQNGNIKFPVIGEIHVAGLTRLELAAKLEKEIGQYIDKPLVSVQISNFKVTMIGEFNTPGSYTIKNDHVSILEAIGLAGDLLISANRRNLLVVRDYDGKKEWIRVDITDPMIMDSPAYYLKQNDVVYAEPIKAKQRSRASADRQYSMSLMSTIVSSLSLITSIVITIVNL